MAFDYYYGQEDAEQYLFYRIPKTLITGDEFRNGGKSRNWTCQSRKKGAARGC